MDGLNIQTLGKTLVINVPPDSDYDIIIMSRGDCKAKLTIPCSENDSRQENNYCCDNKNNCHRDSKNNYHRDSKSDRRQENTSSCDPRNSKCPFLQNLTSYPQQMLPPSYDHCPFFSRLPISPFSGNVPGEFSQYGHYSIPAHINSYDQTQPAVNVESLINQGEKEKKYEWPNDLMKMMKDLDGKRKVACMEEEDKLTRLTEELMRLKEEKKDRKKKEKEKKIGAQNYKENNAKEYEHLSNSINAYAERADNIDSVLLKKRILNEIPTDCDAHVDEETEEDATEEDYRNFVKSIISSN